jgi:uncharacterized Zn finger protein (UPF0148 family)
MPYNYINCSGCGRVFRNVDLKGSTFCLSCKHRKWHEERAEKERKRVMKENGVIVHAPKK